MELTQEVFSQIAGTGVAEPEYEPAHERRKYPRIAFGSRARILPLFDNFSGGGVSVLVRDITLGGIGFLSPKKMSDGDEFVVRLEGTEEKPVYIHCMVRHCELGGMGRTQYVIGAAFEQVLEHYEEKSRPQDSAGADDIQALADPALNLDASADASGGQGRRMGPISKLWTGFFSKFASERSASRLRSRLKSDAADAAALANAAEPQAAAPPPAAVSAPTPPAPAGGKTPLIMPSSISAASDADEAAPPPPPRARSLFCHDTPAPADPAAAAAALDPATAPAASAPAVQEPARPAAMSRSIILSNRTSKGVHDPSIGGETPAAIPVETQAPPASLPLPEVKETFLPPLPTEPAANAPIQTPAAPAPPQALPAAPQAAAAPPAPVAPTLIAPPVAVPAPPAPVASPAPPAAQAEAATAAATPAQPAPAPTPAPPPAAPPALVSSVPTSIPIPPPAEQVSKGLESPSPQRAQMSVLRLQQKRRTDDARHPRRRRKPGGP